MWVKYAMVEQPYMTEMSGSYSGTLIQDQRRYKYMKHQPRVAIGHFLENNLFQR